MSTLTISILVVASIVLIILLTSLWKINAFVVLFLVSLVLAIAVMPDKDILDIMKKGFGNTIASTGFLIIFGSIIAILLDKTGAAITLANYVLSKTGSANATLAMGITGFIAGLSIFCDSGFIILCGLAKSFSAKARVSMPFMAAVLGCSLYAVHCLIPTHPGALAAASILQVNIGNLILFGILFALPGFIAAYYYLKMMTKGMDSPLTTSEVPYAEERPNSPPVWLSILPIVVPLVLIAIGAILEIMKGDSTGFTATIFLFIGQPVMALLIGVVLALLLLSYTKQADANAIFEIAIEKAGPILIITAAGGMFGMIIKETGIGTALGKGLSETGLGLLIPFGIAAIFKTAQGSSTVAIITASSLVAPLLPALGLDSEGGKLFCLLALGAGSMVVSHANDSYFWVITKFSDIHPDSTLRFFSTASAVMGLTVFGCVWVASLFFL